MAEDLIDSMITVLVEEVMKLWYGYIQYCGKVVTHNASLTMKSDW